MPDERGVWTAAELEKMTPAERDELFRASIVTDPAELAQYEHLIERARKKVEARIAATEGNTREG